MSHNHQYIEHSGNIKKRYVKTVPFMISGTRINPNGITPNERVDFLLKTEEPQFDFDKKKINGFNYSDDVLELYSDLEVRLFERLNKETIEAGYLKEFIGDTDSVDTSNLLKDEEIDELVKIKLPNVLKGKLKHITSAVTIERCLDRAKELDRSYKIIATIEDRLAELKSN